VQVTSYEGDEGEVLALVSRATHHDAPPGDVGRLLSSAVELATGLLRAQGRPDRDLHRVLAERLAMGRRVYGPLDAHGDPRDWLQEAFEEAADACAYLGAEAIRRRGAMSPRGATCPDYPAR
jgi:hypothetical protein